VVNVLMYACKTWYTQGARQRLTTGVRNAVLQKNSARTLATETQKCGDPKVSCKQQEHCATHHGVETKPVGPYLQDEGRSTNEVCDVWDNGETDMERKTEQGVVGPHQEVVSRRCPH
jgi:cytochrome c551/c552